MQILIFLFGLLLYVAIQFASCKDGWLSLSLKSVSKCVAGVVALLVSHHKLAFLRLPPPYGCGLLPCMLCFASLFCLCTVCRERKGSWDGMGWEYSRVDGGISFVCRLPSSQSYKSVLSHSFVRLPPPSPACFFLFLVSSALPLLSLLGL